MELYTPAGYPLNSTSVFPSQGSVRAGGGPEPVAGATHHVPTGRLWALTHPFSMDRCPKPQSPGHQPALSWLSLWAQRPQPSVQCMPSGGLSKFILGDATQMN